MIDLRLAKLLPALTLAAGLALPAAASADCDDATGLCVESGAVKWKSDATVSAQTKRKERKLRKKDPVSLSVEISGDGRGTVFLDGRFAGVAPVNNFSLPPGSHEIQVRDGNRILAEGVLSFPAGESASIEIRY
jgi:hypothetical protein